MTVIGVKKTQPQLYTHTYHAQNKLISCLIKISRQRSTIIDVSFFKGMWPVVLCSVIVLGFSSLLSSEELLLQLL